MKVDRDIELIIWNKVLKSLFDGNILTIVVAFSITRARRISLESLRKKPLRLFRGQHSNSAMSVHHHRGNWQWWWGFQDDDDKESDTKGWCCPWLKSMQFIRRWLWSHLFRDAFMITKWSKISLLLSLLFWAREGYEWNGSNSLMAMGISIDWSQCIGPKRWGQSEDAKSLLASAFRGHPPLFFCHLMPQL